MKEIPIEVWVKAHREAMQEKRNDDDGVTTKELAKQLGQSLSLTQRQLGNMVDIGLWEYVKHVVGRRRDGYACRIPVYRPVKEKK